MMITTPIAFGLLAGMLICCVAGAFRHLLNKYRRLSADNAHYHQKYLHHTGWDVTHGSYNYLSIDGGHSWYSIKWEDQICHILEPADPRHINQIIGLQALTDHVQKYGPIDITRPGSTSLLNQAGFTVTRDKD